MLCYEMNETFFRFVTVHGDRSLEFCQAALCKGTALIGPDRAKETYPVNGYFVFL